MIRKTCAWVLLVLAASPVTAPFSSCDLREFFATSAASAPIAAWESAAPVTVAPRAAADDANSVSPVEARSDLRDDGAVTVPGPLFAVALPVGRSVRGPYELNRALREAHARGRVLRV